MKKLLSTLLALLFAAGIFAQNQNDGQKNGSQNQSIVYFTRDVSSAGLMKVYRALNQKIEGSVGIKVSFGGPDEEVLQPELLRELVRTTGGTMFDGNGLSGNRRTSEMNLSHARRHGFMEIGKCIIHSGGTDESHYHSTPADVLEKSFADAAKAALDYKKNWAFINVLDDIEPNDNCRGAKNLGKIGIIASSDIVALEQCTLDFVIEKADVDSAAKAEWKAAHRVGMIEQLEKLGGGTRNYRLVEVK